MRAKALTRVQATGSGQPRPCDAVGAVQLLTSGVQFHVCRYSNTDEYAAACDCDKRGLSRQLATVALISRPSARDAAAGARTATGAATALLLASGVSCVSMR